MSDMEQWAKRETEIACDRERGDKDPNEWDYGVVIEDDSFCYRADIRKRLHDDIHRKD